MKLIISIFQVVGAGREQKKFKQTIIRALALGGVKNPPVVILPPKPLKPCSIRVCKPKIFYILLVVRLHICNLTIHRM